MVGATKKQDFIRGQSWKGSERKAAAMAGGWMLHMDAAHDPVSILRPAEKRNTAFFATLPGIGMTHSHNPDGGEVPSKSL